MRNKILGGLYGQALGDAWAMPAMLSPDATWEYYGGWITEFLPAPDEHPFHAGLPAGRITDDTEQAFALAEALIKEGGISVEAAANAIVAWYDRVDGDNCPYIGPSTRRAVLAIKRGEDLTVTGRFGDTNGAAMRISPIGLAHPGKVEATVEAVRLACTPTHNTEVAISGASAVAGGIAAAMPDGSTLEDIIQSGQRAAKLGRQYGHRWVGASVSRRIAMAVEIARMGTSARERLQELADVIGTSLALPESVPSAFGVLAMADGDPTQTAIYAAALSGDADTIGAMACAIAGAWRGAGAFEDEDIVQLRTANPELDFDGVAKGILELIP